jgi:hypothetical protein
MNNDEMKADLEQAKKNAKEHHDLHLQWLGVMQYLAQKIEAQKKEPSTP